MILTFRRGFFWWSSIFFRVIKKWLCNFCGIFSDTPKPPTLSHLVDEKNYKGIKLQAFNRNSIIQECVCGGVYLSSVIGNRRWKLMLALSGDFFYVYKGPKYPKIWFQRALHTPQRCELNIKHVVLFVGHLSKPFWIKKVWPGWQEWVREGQNMAQNAPPAIKEWPKFGFGTL